MWSPASLILNSFLALHNGLKVLLIASTLRARFVRNFATRTYSFLLRFFDFVRLSFVFSSAIRDIFPCTENFVHGLSKESSIERMERERKKVEMCFPKPTKRKTNQQALLLTMLTEGEGYHSGEDNQDSTSLVSQRESEAEKKLTCHLITKI